MTASHTLTAERLAQATDYMSRGAGLPVDQPARFEALVTAIAKATGRDRTWSRARAREQYPAEAAAAEAAGGYKVPD